LPEHVEFWHPSCPSQCRPNETQMTGGAMSRIFVFTGKWNRWYRVLRYNKGFGLFDSVRYGLWLARGPSVNPCPDGPERSTC
jgi:hypothetical protein